MTEAHQHPFLRNITSTTRSPDSGVTLAHLECGHDVVLFGDLAHLMALYGRLACQCSVCLHDFVKEENLR
jgi:hypothetical protein